MQNKFMKLGAKVTAAATMLAMFASVSPAMAAAYFASAPSDLMTRQAVNATSDHTITMTLPAPPTATWDGDLSLTVSGAGFSFSTLDASSACAGGTITDGGTTGNLIVATLVGCTGGTLTLVSLASTNDAAAGSHSVTTVSTVVDGADTLELGTWALALSDDDQVTVTASVSPTITFDLDTNQTDTNSGAPYSVDLGALTVGATNVSDQATINSIFADLDTNATGGAVVTVLNANDTNGLESLSAPTDFIPSATTTMAAGVANYGLCVESTATGSGTLAAAGSYAAPTCVLGTDGNTTVALSNVTPDPILTTSGGPVTVGRAEILVNAAISTSTAAHNDYQDILTFVATGTF